MLIDEGVDCGYRVLDYGFDFVDHDVDPFLS
jgi:hypothetical protein